jgi:hypothetical protein
MGGLHRRQVLLGCGSLFVAGAAFRPLTALAQTAGTEPGRYPSRLSETEVDAVFERAEQELKAKTSAHVGAWRLDEADWAADLDQGTITFRRGELLVATAPVQVIGTFVADSGSWMWGWDHPSVPAPAAADARRVRDFGKVQGLEALTTRQIKANEEDAWLFTALAAHLGNATGAYRGPAGKAAVFMTFGALTMAAPEPARPR